ncbi:hypothetical protein BGZ57DRAFT_465626 [Hyaloscypha finlandica]|nr:hypothetical protein BGZ57DRAFT_465626 [Hyaloscypha finlandica]
MLPLRYLTALATLLTIALASTFEEDWTTSLLRRQEPGTPAYDCHLNCGTAITIGREATDRCTNSTFLTDYERCLECAGPSNQDIWQLYGRTLSGYGESCGLSTTPVSNTSATTTSASSSTPASTAVLSTSATEILQSSTTAPRNSTTSTSTGASSVGSPSASSPAIVPVTGRGSTSKGSFYGVFVLAFAALFAGLV